MEWQEWMLLQVQTLPPKGKGICVARIRNPLLGLQRGKHWKGTFMEKSMEK
jgi:hypothetical protein